MKPLKPLKLIWVVLKIAFFYKKPISALRLIRRRVHKYLLFRKYKSCKHCGTTKDLTVDHIHPLVYGGSDSLKNKQILCGRCNKRKGSQPDFMRGTMEARLKGFLDTTQK